MLSKRKKMTSDWLNLNPVFYNEKLNKFSHNVNDVIDYKIFSFNPEGFNNYLDYGFSVFGQTPIQDVKFLFPCQEIFKEQGRLKIKNLDDPSDSYYGKKSSVGEVIKKIELSLHKWQKKSNKKIILPLSGGLDSRLLLNLLNKKKSNIFTYTYGTSPVQKRSLEIVNAQIEAAKNNVCWKQISLGSFHNYIEDWYNIFGISTQAHGMYQIEFYKKIKLELGSNSRVLSGIVGDVWAGSVKNKLISKAQDLDKISYNHGLSADSKYSKLKSDHKIRKKYWQKVKNKINDPYYQTIHTIRNKMILLSYLFKVPQNLKLETWSPFIEPKVALTILTLSPKERRGRKWQHNFFKNSKYSFLQKMSELMADRRNNLDIQGCRKVPLEKLNTSLLSKYFDEQYIEWINNELKKLCKKPSILEKLWTHYWIGAFLRKLTKKQWSVLRAYNAYRTIKPIEIFIKRANKKT